MSRTTNPTFIPTTSPVASVMPLDQIPQEIKDEVEEMYAALKKADGRFSISFDTKQEVSEYEKQVKAYCAGRVDSLGQPAPIRYRRSPAKGLPETTIQFRVVDIPVESEKATADIREATEKVNANAKPVDMTEAPVVTTPKTSSRRK